ncbi:inositol monophosphatase family protein [Celeribacter marinus]|uniref:Inositol-1-monophosphatase n=3 Tax=Celeribacter marinus TaxID=1397108 RepID=A0A0N9ZHM7_9RHOB|nr:inositol monophosphatase family protein [Celeribacter marinus]ALI56499.1 inositol-1-monophosphatase [Celeribacter marinus]SFK41402.1 myo-inositol-1(or 4)-monophosphatase [Celeribacter marinus]
MQGSANLNVMIKAARIAGRSLIKDFREVENLQVSTKGAGDFVTKADESAEEIIREMLMEARPTYGYVGEETEEIEGKDPTRRWIVDPLDGTTNFLHGLPHWAVSIALEHRGEIVSAVVFDAAKGELFWAEKGAGAWMNDQRIRVSGRQKLIESIFATGLPFAGRSDLPATLKDLARVLPATAGVRRYGAASLDLAYVAAGRYDGFWERRLKIWDMAAGILLVKEAGGLVEAIDPAGDVLLDCEVLCSNEPLFDKFAKMVRNQ